MHSAEEKSNLGVTAASQAYRKHRVSECLCRQEAVATPRVLHSLDWEVRVGCFSRADDLASVSFHRARNVIMKISSVQSSPMGRKRAMPWSSPEAQSSDSPGVSASDMKFSDGLNSPAGQGPFSPSPSHCNSCQHTLPSNIVDCLTLSFPLSPSSFYPSFPSPASLNPWSCKKRKRKKKSPD